MPINRKCMKYNYTVKYRKGKMSKQEICIPTQTNLKTMLTTLSPKQNTEQQLQYDAKIMKIERLQNYTMYH